MKFLLSIFIIVFFIFSLNNEKKPLPDGKEVLLEMEKEFLNSTIEKGIDGWLSFFLKMLQFFHSKDPLWKDWML